MLHLVGFVLSCGLLLFLAVKCGVSEKSILYCCLFIVILLTGLTLLVGIRRMPIVGLGNLPTFAAVTFVFALKPPSSRSGLRFASILNLMLGAAMVLRYQPVTSYFVDHYNNFYQDLLPTMLAMGKPVLTFASHSIAGLFLYLFFWVNWREFLAERKILYLCLALGHLGLCLALTSHASFAFALIGFSQVAWAAARSHPWKSAAVFGVIVLSITLFTPQQYKDVASDAAQSAQVFWFDRNNKTRSGFWGRYSDYGNMREAIVYVSEYPLSPIGLMGHPTMMLGDSGVLEDFVRGSALLVAVIYGGLWYFLRRSLDSRTALQFFLCVLLIEVGYSVLVYPRTLCLLPLFVSWLKREDRDSFSVKTGQIGTETV